MRAIVEQGYKMWRERKVNDLISNDSTDKLSAKLEGRLNGGYRIIDSLEQI